MAMRTLADSLAVKTNEPRRGHFDTAALLLLGVLMEGDKHGYEIKQLVDSRLSRVTDISSGTIYYTLKKLEKKRLVTRSRMREGNRPERRVYSITGEGKKYFQDLLAQSFRQMDETYYVFDMGFYFLRFADLEQVLEAVQDKMASQEQFLMALRTLEEENPGRWPFAYRALVQRGRMLAETNLKWYQEVAQEIEQRIARKIRGQVTEEPALPHAKEAHS